MMLPRSAALRPLAAVFLSLPGATGFDWGGVFGSPSSDNHATDVLTDSNFEGFIKENPVNAVLFYAPWCYYSQQIMPQWDTAAQKLLLHDPPVRLAKIDVNQFTGVGDRYDVSAYPTMKLFIDGTAWEYDMDLGRNWQAIVKWVNRHIDRDHVLKSADEADRYLNDNELNVVGLFPDEETHPTFLKSARHFPDVMFAEARGATISKDVADHLSAHASLTCETISVGTCKSNTKILKLPREHMQCSSTPRNPQRPEWTDKYEASVEGQHLKIQRLDETGGWDQHLQMKCCDADTAANKEKHKIPVPSVVMFMPHDERFAVYDGDLTDLHALDRWIMARRRPMIMHLSASNAGQISEVGPEHVPGLFLISRSTQDVHVEILQKAAKSLRGRIFVCISERSSQLEQRLAALASVEDDAMDPVLTLIDMHPNAGHSPQEAQQNSQHPSHGAKKFRISIKGLTEELLVKFVDDFEQGRLKPWLKSEPEPTAEDLAEEDVGVLVGSTYVEGAQKEDKDVLVSFFAPWCGYCRKLEPLYKALAKNLKHVKTLNIMKIDATRNEIEDMQIQGYPTIVLFPAGTRPKNKIIYHGHRSPDDMSAWLQQHVTKKFDPKPPPVRTGTAGDDPVESGLLDPSEEDL